MIKLLVFLIAAVSSPLKADNLRLHHGDVKTIKSCLGKEVAFKNIIAPKIKKGMCYYYIIPSAPNSTQWYSFKGKSRMFLSYASDPNILNCDSLSDDRACHRPNISSFESDRIESIVSSVDISNTDRKLEIDFTPPSQRGVLTFFGDVLSYGSERPIKTKGIMLDSISGDKVISPESGYIIISENIEGIGSIVAIDHGQGIVSIIIGFTSFNDIATGSAISRKDVLGVSYGSPVFWSIKVRGVSINPLGNITEVIN